MKIPLYHLLILTALLLWVGCEIPVSPLPNVGDEMRLTNDPRPNYDPFEYSFIEPVTLDSGIIGYHDNESICLFDLSSKESSVIYTVENGWVITALSRIEHLEESYCFSVTDGVDVILYASINGDVQVVYEFNGLPIDGIDCMEEGQYLYILIEIDKQIFYIRYDYTLKITDINMYLDEGYDVWLDNRLVEFYYIKEVDTFEQLYSAVVLRDGSYFESLPLDYPEFNESNKRYPVNYYCVFATSDISGQVDIWNFLEGYQLTNSSEAEADLYSFSDFILFNRTVGVQNDLYILRATDIPDF